MQFYTYIFITTVTNTTTTVTTTTTTTTTTTAGGILDVHIAEVNDTSKQNFIVVTATWNNWQVSVVVCWC